MTASDNDPIAVDVAAENAKLNGVSELIDFHLAEGVDLPGLAGKSPYDLIVANIVANPLIALSVDIAGALSHRSHRVVRYTAGPGGRSCGVVCRKTGSD